MCGVVLTLLWGLVLRHRARREPDTLCTMLMRAACGLLPLAVGACGVAKVLLMHACTRKMGHMGSRDEEKKRRGSERMVLGSYVQFLTCLTSFVS